jgi:sugar/nucleoside kinase (ribokinase family)
MTVRYGVIGAFTIDHVINAQGEVAPRQCGGNATYAAVGARLWSESVGVVGRVGEDYPREWLEQLAAAGLDLSGVHPISGPHRMEGGMLYDDAGTRHEYSPTDYFTHRNQPVPPGMPEIFWRQSPAAYHSAQMDFAPDPADVPASFLTARRFHLSPRFYVKHQASLNLLTRHGIPVTMDPGVWYMAEKDEAKLAALFKDVEVLLPSEAEVYAYYGEGDLDTMARQLAAYGPRVVVIKLGRRGCLVYERERDRITRLPVYPARVKDPTGAGDSFGGGYMVGYDETGDAVRAALYGTVSSSFIVEGFSALYPLQFTRRDAEARLATLAQLANLEALSW